MWSISVDAADLIMDVCSCIPGRHQQDEAMHFCCGQPPRHGCEKRNVFFNNLEISSELLEMEWNGQKLLALLDISLMFQGHFKHTGGSILLCLLLYTFFAWVYNCHRDTVVSILVYQVDSWQVSPASVTSSRFHTSPTLPKAHSHLRGLPAEDGFFGVRGWWVKKWDPRKRNCGLMLLDVWLFSYEQSGHESTRKRQSSSGKVTRDFDGLMGFGVPNFETRLTGKIYPWAWIAWEEIRGNSLPG